MESSSPRNSALYCLLFAFCLLVYMVLFLRAEAQMEIFGYLVLALALAVVGMLTKLGNFVGDVLRAKESLWEASLFVMAVLLIAIFYEDDYNLFLIGTIMCYAVAVLGLNVQLGFTGVINFSSASFFGIGCYTAAMLVEHTPIPPLLVMILGGVFAALIGCALLLPVLRTSGNYAALVTMAFALLFNVFLDICEFFGGSQGASVGSMSLFGVEFTESVEWFGLDGSFYIRYDIMALILLTLAFLLVKRIERSWIGLSLDVVREDEVAASCFGMNIARWKITAFTIGNFVAGLAGGLYAMMLGYISPANYTFADSLLFLSILLLGGIGNRWGVLLATGFVVVVPEKFQMIQEYRFLIYSALVLLMIVFRPTGLLPRGLRRFVPGGAA